MYTLTLTPSAASNTVIKCRPARVYVGGERRREFKVLTLEALPAPLFGHARLALCPSRLSGTKGRIENIGALPPVGTRVLICPAHGSGGYEFPGVITGHHAEITEDRESLIAEADHLLAAMLAGKLASRWQVAGNEPAEIQQSQVAFNGSRSALASEATFEIGTRQTRVFDSGTSAREWSVADALGYLIATAVPQDVEAPSMEELAWLAGDIPLGRLVVTGKGTAEALVEAARRGGLEIRASREGLGLVFYRPGYQGRVSSVCLQCPGESLLPARSNLWQGRIILRRRPSRPTVMALGGHKRYESTFRLQRGWNPALQTSRWRDFVRSESGNWPQLANVYRKWVLNEHGWYSRSPWDLDVYDFWSISTQDFLFHAPHRFLPCLSTDHTGNSLGIVVEFRRTSTDEWERWALPVWTAGDECAVYLGGDGLPGEFFQAAADGTVEVRVTATVEADTRLTAQVPGDPGSLCEVLDFSAQVTWRKVHSSSIFFGDKSIGEPNERDDTDVLTHLAQRYAEAATGAAEAELTLGWVDTSYSVGDIIERIDGRAFELSSSPDSKPFVRSVKHDLGDGQNTTLVVSG